MNEQQCNCPFRIRMVGDGCPVCNPDFWAEHFAEYDNDDQPTPTTPTGDE